MHTSEYTDFGRMKMELIIFILLSMSSTVFIREKLNPSDSLVVDVRE